MRTIGLDFGSVYTKAVLIDGGGRIALELYRKEQPAGPVESFLRDVERAAPGERFIVGMAGSRPAAPSPFVFTNALLAISAGIRELHPRARSIIEIGGHTSKFMIVGDSSSIRDFSTNEACAAGTGSFLEQQARRMQLGVEDLAALAVEAKTAATIAGRCSVFAKSDMIHLQQKGTPVAEIAYGLCMAICRNANATLLKARAIAQPVVIAGGCARNGGVLRAFRETLGTEILVSSHPGLEAAIGAAALARRGEARALTVGEIRAELAALLAKPAATSTNLRPLERPARGPSASEPTGIHAGPAEAWLGVDVGSVSTDLVLLDRDGELLSSVYLPTRGRPVDVMLDGLAILRARFPAGLRITGCGATGSGRHLAAKLLNTDAVKNEITCQMLGARRFVPGADTILEIGGQDSKFIALRNGAIADFAMNKICAAGTGSFLEEQAREMGIEIERDFAAQAFASRAPLDLGTRCTVFMDTEVVNALRDGAPVSDICAGLAYSIVNNYLEKVVASRPLGETIVFQGGVASNDAVVAAFEQVIGKPIHVHPWNRLSGAIGAALAAMDAVAAAGHSTFREVAETPALRTFECRHCSNRCEVGVVSVGRERAFFGDTCERYTSRTAMQATTALPPNLADEYVARCEAAFGGEPRGLTIGIPRASYFFDGLAFWAAFVRALGHTPVLSPPSSEETLASGLKHLAVGVCLPIKMTAGQVQSLLARGVDRVFLPAIVRLPGAPPERSYSCPYAMAAPFIVSTTNESRFLTPMLSMEDEEAFLDSFEPCLAELQATRESARAAWQYAVEVQAEIDDAFRRRAAELTAARGQRHAFAILGKPYNVLDPYVNLSLFERLRRMGVLAIPQKFLPLPDAADESALPWKFSGDIERAVAGLERADGIHPVVVSSFGCGPDAFTFKQIEPLLARKAHLILEFDEHRGEAGLVTRIEAFLDQLDARRPPEIAFPAANGAEPAVPPPGSIVHIPYFSDHAHAYAGLLRLSGCTTRILPPPTQHVRVLGERHSIGKECHAYSMLAGDLLESSRISRAKSFFFFPGTSLPCLLHEYGRGMRMLLRKLGIDNVTVCVPTGAETFAAFPIDALERFYLGLMSIELLVKGLCQVRPYEREKGTTDEVHAGNLVAIEDAIAGGNILEALDLALARLWMIPTRGVGTRPVVGMSGDVYTKSNAAANTDLVRWLEERGLEVWPSPFQIDIVDFGISRNLSQSVASLDLGGLLLHGSLAADRAIQQWRVLRVAGGRVTRSSEPDYAEMKKLAGPYMPNEAQELLFINVAKLVDFASNGADGIINAICFNCMIGNASAAIAEKIRRDFDDIPIITAVYSGGEDPSRKMVLEAFVSQVIERRARRDAAAPSAARPPAGLLPQAASRLQNFVRNLVQ